MLKHDLKTRVEKFKNPKLKLNSFTICFAAALVPHDLFTNLNLGGNFLIIIVISFYGAIILVYSKINSNKIGIKKKRI
jgi:hypothetical protein